MKKTLFLTPDYLEETPYLADIHFLDEAKSFFEKIHKIEKSCVFGLIGDFGSGKSTMLNDMKGLRGKNDLRMVFDSRKFPERKELWDGFVLSVTANIMHNKYKEISDKIENKERTNEILEMAEQIPLLSVASKIIKKIINGDGGSGVKRIDEYQKLLEEIIKKVAINREYTKGSEVYNNIYIILEDVDRSGQEGIYFLETLNNFIKSLDIDVIHSRIICICPIAEENLEANFQKYLKVFDYYDFFKPYINTVNFIDNLFNKKVLTKEQKPIVLGLINSLLLEEPKNTMREVKFIFRTAYSHYLETKKDVDWFVYFLAQIYRRGKNYPQYEIDNKRKEEVKKGIKKNQ